MKKAKTGINIYQTLSGMYQVTRWYRGNIGGERGVGIYRSMEEAVAAARDDQPSQWIQKQVKTGALALEDCGIYAQESGRLGSVFVPAEEAASK